ncbi:hypothetical protein [Rhodoblastus sp.]|uniref:hypothetical protein n=1 Tax=Rhodoblastus sp. TaxID=1962975 RepID=UPI0026096B9E|nr:hypothetical protein [Rhodoblastus sp.]
MAITTSDLREIDGILGDPDADGRAVSLLRQALPHLAVARCDASDLEDRPARLYPKFDLHFFDNSDHCMKIVASAEAATGVILAQLSKPRTIA